MRLTLDGSELAADFGGERRVLSSAVLGGGLTRARSWLNATVPPDYSRLDPEADLAERAARLGLPRPVVGMLTAVDVREHRAETHGAATVIATVGIGHPLAAAGTRPRAVGPREGPPLTKVLAPDIELLSRASTPAEAPPPPLPRDAPAAGSPPGTINLLVFVDAPLTDAGLAGAAQTAIEAKAQALADANVRAGNASSFATGTATDAFCIAAPDGATVPFAGPATRVGGDIGRAVHAAVLAGAIAQREAVA